MTSETIIKRLADLIFAEMVKSGYSTTFFADICGVHRNVINAILCGNKKDVKLSTVIKICENSNISYAELFGLSDYDLFNKMIRDFYFTDGVSEWHLVKKKKGKQ